MQYINKGRDHRWICSAAAQILRAKGAVEDSSRLGSSSVRSAAGSAGAVITGAILAATSAEVKMSCWLPPTIPTWPSLLCTNGMHPAASISAGGIPKSSSMAAQMPYRWQPK
jgi:hypothetical protein